MNVMIEMASLSLSRPMVGATNEVIAAWFEAKARLHEYLANQGGADAAHERTLADSAHEKSVRLLSSVA